jgi:hypothetical protein
VVELLPVPTAHTSLLATPDTPLKKFPGTLGLGTTLQEVPLKCSASGLIWPVLGFAIPPTAQTSLGPISATALREDPFTLGAATVCRPVDSKVRPSSASSLGRHFGTVRRAAGRARDTRRYMLLREESMVQLLEIR